MSFHGSKLVSYFAMLQTLTHIGQAAAHAVSTGEDPNGALAKVSAHLDSFSKTVDEVGAILPVIQETVDAVQQSIPGTAQNSQ